MVFPKTASHSFAGVRGLKSSAEWMGNPISKSHSFAGVRGLKFEFIDHVSVSVRVALLRGGAWIEIYAVKLHADDPQVALLRGGAWIEITRLATTRQKTTVALLRGGAWIEINQLLVLVKVRPSRTPSRGCVD